MLITKTVDVYCKPANKKHFLKKGYEWENNKLITVNASDLSKHSSIKVDVMCDCCADRGVHTIFQKAYVSYRSNEIKGGKDFCIGCREDKSVNTYGANNTTKNSDRVRYSKSKFDNIIKLYEQNGCELISTISEYKGSESKLEFICACGEVEEKPFSAFKLSPYCRECCIGNCTRGKDHYAWKGGISKGSRSEIKRSDEYKQWRVSVYSRDAYTCQCCGDNKGGKLHAHHLANFSDNIKLRFNVDNGITLCSDCHNPSMYGSFHNVYGTKNNTSEQVVEYIKKYNDGKFAELKKKNIKEAN